MCGRYAIAWEKSPSRPCAFPSALRMKPATSGSATRKFCASASAAPSCAAMPRQLSATSISTNRITRRVCSSVSSRIVRASAWEKSPTSGGAGAVGAARAIASSSASARGNFFTWEIHNGSITFLLHKNPKET